MNAPEDRHRRRGEGSEKCAAGGCVRKKYAPPELVIYGSLTELTGVGGKNDNLDFTFTGSRQTG